MRIHAIKAKNFLSLQAFSLENLDPQLNLIVGPNGSGKSSVFRAVRALIDGTRCVGFTQPFEDGQFLCARGSRDSSSEEFEVVVDVTFDREWERDLIVTYLCAAVTHPEDVRADLSRLDNSVIASDEGAVLYANWLLEGLRPEQLPYLFRGELRFSYRHFVRDYLQLTYTFFVDGAPLTISMAPQTSHYGVFTASPVPATLSGNNPAIGSVLFDYWKSVGAERAIREMILDRRITTDTLPEAFDAKIFVQRLVGANAVLEVKTIPRARFPYPGPHKHLNELAGRKFDDQQQSIFTFGELMHVLLTQGIIMTNNFRHPPERTYAYPLTEGVRAPSGMYDDRQLPLRLFDLKNGDHAATHRYRQMQDAFKELVGDGLIFDVVRSAAAEELTLEIRTTVNGVEIPITYHGAGIWEALVLTVLLYDNTGKILLLDEPASNLHANLQRKFLDLLQRTQARQGGGQTLVVTHSQHLLPTQAKDLPKIRRLQRVEWSTAVFGLGPRSQIPLDRLEKEMSDGSDLAGLLFASGVILVEGATETAAINTWYPDLEMSRGHTLADSNITLFSVDGVQNLPLHIQYLVEYGVPWVVICDADALDLTRRHDLWRKLVALGSLSSEPTQNVFSELKQTAAAGGVFTANTGLEEKGFEDVPEVKEYIAEHEADLPDKNSKPRRGRYIAQHLACPAGVVQSIQAALAWLQKPAQDNVSRYAHAPTPVI